MAGSALDTFRAQQEAVDAIHQRLQDVASLLHRMNTGMEAIAHNTEYKQLLAREESWLREAQNTVAEVSAFRAREVRALWPRIGRSIVAAMFAIASAAAAGAGYAWITQPYAAEINDLKSRWEFAEYVERRVVMMTPAQRRQFDSLMQWPATGGTNRH
jgi:hypothetical protein